MNMIVDERARIATSNVVGWYERATVRTRPRIMVPASAQSEDIYPRSRQALATHPTIMGLGEEAVRYILNQSTYKYMYEIGLLETRFVIDCALKIINRAIYPGASDEERLDAITIVIDEGYHAHVALDFIIQMKAVSAVEPLSVPSTNRNLDAVRRTAAKLPERMQDTFELVAVCLAEHTLTKDLLSIGKERDTTLAFTQVMTDHVADEGRHAGYFSRLLSAYWLTLDDETKTAIGTLLPAHLDDYLAGDDDRLFDRQVMAAVGLDANQIETVLKDTDQSYFASVNSYIGTTKANLVNLLKRMGMLNHPATRAAFLARGLVE